MIKLNGLEVLEIKKEDLKKTTKTEKRELLKRDKKSKIDKTQMKRKLKHVLI